ncbi:MAG TPA: hypothetical protein PKK12_11400 [Candidatus Aminicenantes bacterium]|nr:hypothetical protein [Candidatus Aminicenantes bacterium]
MTDRNWIVYGSLCAVGWVGVVLRDVAGKWYIVQSEVRRWWRAAANAGANAVRVHWFAVDPDNDRANSITPWLWDAAAQAWDLSKPDPEYYSTVLRGLYDLAVESGLTFWFCLTDQCGQKESNAANTPMRNNVQGITGGLFRREMYPYLREHVRRCLAVLPTSDRFPDGRPTVVLECGNEIIGNGAAEMVEAVIAPELAAIKLPGDQISIGAYVGPRTWDPERGDYTGGTTFVQLDLIQRALQKVYTAKWGEAWGTAVRRLAYRPNHSWLESPEFPGRPFGERHELGCYESAAGGRQCQQGFSTDGTQMLPSDPHSNPDDHDDGDEGGNRRPLPSWLYAGAMDIYQRFAKGSIYMQEFGALIPGGTVCRVWFEHLPSVWNLAVHVAGIEALAQAHKDFWGVWPANYGNVPPIVEPGPEPEPQPEPEPEPPVTPPVVTPPVPPKVVTWHWHFPFLHINFPLLWKRIRRQA